MNSCHIVRKTFFKSLHSKVRIFLSDLEVLIGVFNGPPNNPSEPVRLVVLEFVTEAKD